MRHVSYLMMMVATLAVATGCNNPQPQEANAEGDSNVCQLRKSKEDIVGLETPQGIKLLVGIRDKDQFMSAELFEGYDDTVMAEYMPDGKAEAGINVYALFGKEMKVLFDCGVGEGNGGQLMSKLADMGLSGDSITDICFTHLHFDHIGGLFTTQGKAAFPKATLHIPQEELDAWVSGPLKEQNEQVKRMLELYDGRIELFNAGDSLLGCIRTFPAPGHTPGHTVYAVKNYWVLGDLVHVEDMQVAHPEMCARFDFEKDKAVESRCRLLEKMKAEDACFYFMHASSPTARMLKP